jgi:hypothetical protein
MKRVLLMTVLAVGAVNADIIPNLASGPGAVSCDFDMSVGAPVCTYQYTATVHSQAQLTAAKDEAEFFTIYDFNGYLDGTGVAPTGWVFSTEFLGQTPGMIAIGANDSDSVPNLTFTYVGGENITDGRTISGFSAKSIFGPATVDGWYSSQSHKQGDTPGSIAQNVGQVQVPQPPQSEPGDVPEPMSMALLGGGLAALGLLPRRFKKN